MLPLPIRCLTALTLLLTPVSAQQLEPCELRHQDRTRSYEVYDGRPSGATSPAPGLLVLHGGTGSARQIARRTDYVKIAQREGLVIVFPEGLNGQWNDGRGVPSVTGVDMRDVDDVGFFAALFDALVADHGVDPTRIYVTGASNGGTMAYRLAIELGDRIAGIAAAIANLPEPMSRQPANTPVPVLIMNGTDDPLMTWAGTPPGHTGPSGGVLLGTWDTVHYWVRANRDTARPRLITRHLPDRDPQDGSTVQVTEVEELRAPVVLYTVHGGGHTLPGYVGIAPRFVGNVNRDIVGEEEIWRFLAQQRRTRSATPARSPGE